MTESVLTRATGHDNSTTTACGRREWTSDRGARLLLPHVTRPGRTPPRYIRSTSCITLCVTLSATTAPSLHLS